jgi:hypothetical protein
MLGRGGRWKGRNQARMHNAGMKQVS